jgi:hypothetical protein
MVYDREEYNALMEQQMERRNYSLGKATIPGTIL